ncbi:MAG: hypothetical protein U0X73_14775 [Thermoanaerobaculia bacterium]
MPVRSLPSLAALVAAALAAAFAASAALAQTAVAVRPGDATGVPNGFVDVGVLSFAGRGVGQGQLGMQARGPQGTRPLTNLVSATVLSGQGDAQITTQVFDFPTQTLTLAFDSPSATINEQAGVFAILRFQLDASLTPGTTWDLVLSDLELFDADSQPIETEAERGLLTVHAENEPLELEVEANEILPGETAIFGPTTEQAFAIESGKIVLQYDPAIASGPPVVTHDPALGGASFTVSAPAENRIQIDFTSPGATLNAALPGMLFTVSLPTLPSVPPGTRSDVTIVGASSVLLGPGATPIAIEFDSGKIKFEDPTQVFDESFEGGDLRGWSSEPF